MVYTDTWDGTFEDNPEDSDDIGKGAEEIRDLKLALRERLEHDHYWDPAGTDADHGEHKQVTLRELAADPTNEANKGFLYTKDDSGDTELYYIDDSGNVVQITADGALKVVAATVFPAGTKMYFYQDSAPTGWTYDSAVTDRCLGVKGGSAAYNVAGGNQAGAWTHTHGVGSHTHTYSGTPSVTVNSESAHTHTVSQNLYGLGTGDTSVDTGATTGVGSSHTHTATSSVSGTTGGGSGTSDANTTFRPYAAVGIIATKD